MGLKAYCHTLVQMRSVFRQIAWCGGGECRTHRNKAHLQLLSQDISLKGFGRVLRVFCSDYSSGIAVARSEQNLKTRLVLRQTCKHRQAFWQDQAFAHCQASKHKLSSVAKLRAVLRLLTMSSFRCIKLSTGILEWRFVLRHLVPRPSLRPFRPR